MVFVPNGCSRGYEQAKDFRPICLSFFVLKTLKRILDIALRPIMERTPFSKCQHTYFKGKSSGRYTTAFLDKGGSFNKVSTKAIKEVLTRIGLGVILRIE